ncbi:ectomycorrhiza-regulated protein [Moniliophthora roreri MCA 2997]|uniref:Ectomycorrhiza-regulated protein n=1 Tax=Moniliophthora roreri (strain MCA 2997) TaxID=1381753 RepID=V2X287_MONRO|nr:ectomycorrhiza-regulated protein [Moniliophthora roreri MCA 2997]
MDSYYNPDTYSQYQPPNTDHNLMNPHQHLPHSVMYSNQSPQSQMTQTPYHHDLVSSGLPASPTYSLSPHIPSPPPHVALPVMGGNGVSRGVAPPSTGPIRRRYSPEHNLPVDNQAPPRRRRETPAIPPYYRRRPQISDEEDDEYIEELPPNATEQQRAEHQRHRNTLAARRSRKRKEVYKQQLEETVDRLTVEKEKWKTRAEMLRRIIEHQGLPVPCGDWSE